MFFGALTTMVKSSGMSVTGLIFGMNLVWYQSLLLSLISENRVITRCPSPGRHPHPDFSVGDAPDACGWPTVVALMHHPAMCALLWSLPSAPRQVFRTRTEEVSRNRHSGLGFEWETTCGRGTMAGAAEEQVSLTPDPSPGGRGVRKGTVIIGQIRPSPSGRGATG